MTTGALHDLSIAELSGLIRKRAASPVEIVLSQLARIGELEGILHACAVVMAESAVAEARKAEAEILASQYRGPLHGVPIAIKDLFLTKGVRTQGGLRVLSGHVPESDAAAVRSLKDAGAVLIAKLHTTEGAMDGYHRDFPIPRNPWGLDRWPGVSSSGSGVAVAAGMCYGSIGTDTGGSVRIPAAANGIVGLKPTRALISTEGVLPLAPSLDHVGPMARSMGDVAILLEALSGLEKPAAGIEGLRIGFDGDLFSGVDGCVTDAVRQALGIFESRGARLVPARLQGLDAMAEIWYTIAAVEAAHAHRATFPSRQSEYGRGFRAFLERGRNGSSEAYEEAQRRRAEWCAGIAESFREFDVLASPGLPGEPFQYNPEDAYSGPDPAAGRSDGIPLSWLATMNRLMLPFNLTGYPAVTLPCGKSPTGMPLSMQLVACTHAEPLLIRCGIAYELETPWHRERPTV